MDGPGTGILTSLQVVVGVVVGTEFAGGVVEMA
jgi:hypothetical protein